MSTGNKAAIQQASSELTGQQLGSSVSFYWSKQLILQHLNTVISAGPQTDLTLPHILRPSVKMSHAECVRKHLSDAVSINSTRRTAKERPTVKGTVLF